MNGGIAMAYIPTAHEKYDLLPSCRKGGGEVFSYSPTDDIDRLLPEGESVIPYGYSSYEEYFTRLDSYVTIYGTTDGELNQLSLMIGGYIEDIKKRNVKENWSVVQYLGESSEGIGGFTHSRYYYWPCSLETPEYEGVIDDEEFTSYLAWGRPDSKTFDEIDPVTWVIAEDPTGMATKFLRKEVSQYDSASG